MRWFRTRPMRLGIPKAVPVQEPVPVSLDMDEELRRDFADVYKVCREATDEILGLIGPGGYERLALHSPGLAGYDWPAYIGLSALRVAKVARALKTQLPAGGAVLDFGSYFGNFALAVQKLGYATSALDSYADYHPALHRELSHMREAGIRVLDSSGDHTLLDKLDETFDAILLLGVIEHIPHTPKGLLEYICRHLSTGGILILDTPNLAYIYRRESLAEGETVFPDITTQFHTAVPFEGHHREYTVKEVDWMLKEVGLSIDVLETYNYSLYGAGKLVGDDARRYKEMLEDATKKEVIFAVATNRCEQ